MIYRTSQNDIDNYYQANGINRGAIKIIVSGGMQNYIDCIDEVKYKEDDYYYEEKEHYLIGNAVDTYFTMGENVYNDKYYFSKVPKPADGLLSIVKNTYDIALSNEILASDQLRDYKPVIHQACNNNSYYMNRAKSDWEADSRIETVLKDPKVHDYFTDLIKAKNKQVLGENQHQITTIITSSINTHPNTAWLFEDGSNTDTVYQFISYFDIDGIYCKVMLDMIRVDHNTKTIYPIDLKTTGKYVTQFNRVIYERRHDIQGSLYTKGLSQSIDILEDRIGKKLTDYRIAPFAFIAESTKKPGTPLIFVMTPELLRLGQHGGFVNEKEIWGWEQGLGLYKLWSENNFQLDEVVSSLYSKGVVQVNEYFDYPKTF